MGLVKFVDGFTGATSVLRALVMKRVSGLTSAGFYNTQLFRAESVSDIRRVCRMIDNDTEDNILRIAY